MAVDFLIPDPIDKLVKLCRNFHSCFLVVDLNEHVEIYRELEEASVADEVEMIERVLEEWAEKVPPECPLPPEARPVVEQWVKGLRAAKTAAASGKNAGEALLASLNVNLLNGKHLDAPKLDAAQRSLGQLLMASRLGALTKPPQPLVIDAPSLPGYTFLRELGSGAFGTVRLAQHAPTGTLRAVKVGPLTDPARFRQEVAIARELNSPHLVRYFESGEVDGQFWIAMEYLGDTTLAHLMGVSDFRTRPFLLPQIGEQLLAALAALHTGKMIHRDLKPTNVMVDDQFRLKLIDFGLAKPIDKLHRYASTTTGTVIGTPLYMSPEQMQEKKDLTPASDVYAAGVLIYELFVGQQPHRGDSFADVAANKLTRSIPFDLPALPPELRPFLERCLARETHTRYPDGRAALVEYRSAARQACRRLRHDYFKPAWVPVLDQQMIESFAAKHADMDAAEEAAELFEQYVVAKGLQPVDRERVTETWPHVAAVQRRVKAGDGATRDVTAVVRAHLASETQEWVKYIEPKNLDRWQKTGESEQWVGQHQDGWSAQQLQDLLDKLRRGTEFWPINQAGLGDHLEGKRQELIEKQRREEQKQREQAERQRRERADRDRRREALKGRGAILFLLVILGVVAFGCYSFYNWVFVPKYSEERVLTGYTDRFRSVAFSSDGTRLVTVSEDKTLRVWDPSTGKQLLRLTGQLGNITSVAFSPDGTRLATGGDNTVRVSDASTGWKLFDVAGHTGEVCCVAFSPDGTRLASGDDNTIRVWDAINGSELLKLTGHLNLVRSVAFSPDGTRLASAGDDETVRVWDAATGKQLHNLSAYGYPVRSVVFNPDGTRLASGGHNTVRVWDVSTGSELLILRGHTSEVLSVAFNPDGTRLASGSTDETVRVWDAVSGKELVELTGHTGRVSSVAFCPTGTRLASGSADNTVRIWKRRK